MTRYFEISDLVVALSEPVSVGFSFSIFTPLIRIKKDPRVRWYFHYLAIINCSQKCLLTIVLSKILHRSLSGFFWQSMHCSGHGCKKVKYPIKFPRVMKL